MNISAINYYIKEDDVATTEQQEAAISQFVQGWISFTIYKRDVDRPVIATGYVYNKLVITWM